MWIKGRKILDPRIKIVIQFIEAHVAERNSIKEVTKIINLSGNYFSILFKNEVGVEFSYYVRLIKIKKAKAQLRESTLPIKSIAYDVGFRHVPNFSRAFKNNVGISPSEYRKKMMLYRWFYVLLNRKVKNKKKNKIKRKRPKNSRFIRG